MSHPLLRLGEEVPHYLSRGGQRDNATRHMHSKGK